jgi:hypothetical protein
VAQVEHQADFVGIANLAAGLVTRFDAVMFWIHIMLASGAN